ncbi:MAG: hypothetical protein ACR2QG_10115 [Gammaproteobacteria bacterium]
MTQTSIAMAIETHGPELMELKSVVGIGESLCNGQPCIRVYLSEADFQTLNEIPAKLDGITVIKEISGPISASGSSGLAA